MAINPNIRVVTAATTIPEGTLQAGTFTTNATHNDRLDYSGTATALNNILGDGQNNSTQEKNNLWIYIPTSSLCLNILSWGGTVVRVDGDASGVAAEAWYLVEGDLSGWSVLNQGGSAGTIDGQSLASGASVTFSDANAPKDRRRFCDVIQVSGSGTSLLIEERK